MLTPTCWLIYLAAESRACLYKKLVYELQIAQDVDAGRYPLKLDSMFTIQATCKPGVTPEKLEQAMATNS